MYILWTSYALRLREGLFISYRIMLKSDKLTTEELGVKILSHQNKLGRWYK